MNILILLLFIYIPHSYSASQKLSFLGHSKITSAAYFEIPLFENLPAPMKRRMGKIKYAKSVAFYNQKYKKRSFKFDYLSDGLKVKGVLITPPKFTSAKKYPLIIYNRGGNREFGKIIFTTRLARFYADKGYVVFASQYRGNDGGEGKEEFGGADVNDVLNLLDISKSLKFVDNKNTFMIGASRGGMMTYLALKKGASVNAAISLYAPSDLFLSAKNRPEMEQTVYNELIPNMSKSRTFELKSRSAIFWVDKINKPLLLLHGDKDLKVSPKHSVLLEAKMKKLDKKVRLKIYKGEKHGISGKMKDTFHEIHNWLNSHKVLLK